VGARDKQLQTNAADPRQVKRAAQKAREAEDRTLLAMRAVLKTPEGRLLIWGLLGFRPADQTVFDHSGSQMYFREGERNFGLRIKALAIEADEDAFQLMEREQRALAKREENENAAHHTTAAADVEGTGDV